jgi:hypothetical protein
VEKCDKTQNTLWKWAMISNVQMKQNKWILIRFILMNLYCQSQRLFIDLGAAITIWQPRQSSTPCLNETSHVRTDLIIKMLYRRTNAQNMTTPRLVSETLLCYRKHSQIQLVNICFHYQWCVKCSTDEPTNMTRPHHNRYQRRTLLQKVQPNTTSTHFFS